MNVSARVSLRLNPWLGAINVTSSTKNSAGVYVALSRARWLPKSVIPGTAGVNVLERAVP